jgi:hypothetical protein
MTLLLPEMLAAATVGEAASLSPSTKAPAPIATSCKPRFHHLAVMVSIGAPDGFGIAVGARPLHWLRLHFGLLENMVSPGLYGGVTFIPLPYWISPTVSLEGGHFFEGNANALVGWFAHQSQLDLPLLRSVGYDFATAHVGVELGSRRCVFFLHGGASYVSGSLTHVQESLQPAAGSTTVVARAISVKVIGPSAKLGLAIYFY